MDPVLRVLHDQGPLSEDDLARLLGSGRTPEDVTNELRRHSEQGLIALDVEGYWNLTAAGAALF
jgi:predicted transcriptional regulator